MRLKLKPISEQVLVITGATSGIGLATARLALRRGARVVLSSRNERELERVSRELESSGRRESRGEPEAPGRQIAFFAADVADKEAVQNLADFAFENFGRIDTWINNAGVALFGRLTETEMADKRRLMDVNFWGVVNGARAAVPYLWEQGGALIHVGWNPPQSQLLHQGIVAASKEALRAYTRSLRAELESENSPISVSLVLPTSVATPYYEHARHRLHGLRPVAPEPSYSAETVARAILRCAEHAIPELRVGGEGLFSGWLSEAVSRLLAGGQSGAAASANASAASSLCEPGAGTHEGNLYQPPDVEGHETVPGRGRRRSLITETRVHPVLTGMFGVLPLIAGFGFLALRRLHEARRSEREFLRNRAAAYLENIAA